MAFLAELRLTSAPAEQVYDPDLASLLAGTLSYLLRPGSPSTSDPAPVQPTALIAGTIRNLDTWLHFLACCREEQLEVTAVELLVPEGGAGIVGAEGWEGEGEVRVVRIERRAEDAGTGSAGA